MAKNFNGKIIQEANDVLIKASNLVKSEGNQLRRRQRGERNQKTGKSQETDVKESEKERRKTRGFVSLHFLDF